ncbi:MAG: PAS domain-containing protein [Rubrivivax sp.]
MQPAPRPDNEARRLQRLRELLVLDTAPEPVFDNVARMASEICGVPIALISLIDAERQWFKANVGLPGVNETARDVAFCAHAIHDDALFEVPDALQDRRFADNPLVAGAPDIRFYAGAPLVLSGGERVGTLCVIDRQARRLSSRQAQQLRGMAQIAVQALEMRRGLIDRALAVRSTHEVELAKSEARHRAILDAQSELVSQARPSGCLVYVNPAYAHQFGRTVGSIVGDNLFDYVDPADHDAVRERIDWVLATGETLIGENRMHDAGGDEVWFAWTNTRQVDPDGHPLLHSVGRDISARKRAEKALRDNEQFLRDLTDSLPVRIAHVDAERRYRFVNRLHCERFALPREQILGRTRAELLGQASHAEVERRIDAVLAGTPQVFEFGEMVDGQPRVLESRLVPALRDGRVQGFFSTSFDITERAENARELQRQSSILNTVTEAIPAIVSVVDRDLRYRFVNAAFERWHGMPREDILGQPAGRILPAADVDRSLARAQQALAGEPAHFERHYPDREGTPHLAVSYVPIRLANGSVDGFVGIAQDITQHRLEQARLRKLAQRDPLTGLLNRAGFAAEMEARIGADGGRSLALLYVDLDHFKPVNDRHGHPVGDQLLQLVAQRFQALVRPSDAVARLGGDEFALLLSGVRSQAHAEAVAHKIVETACRPFEVGALQLQIGASVGVAFAVHAAGGAQGLVARADTMLYRAKQAGRGRVVGEPVADAGAA